MWSIAKIIAAVFKFINAAARGIERRYDEQVGADREKAKGKENIKDLRDSIADTPTDGRTVRDDEITRD